MHGNQSLLGYWLGFFCTLLTPRSTLQKPHKKQPMCLTMLSKGNFMAWVKCGRNIPGQLQPHWLYLLLITNYFLNHISDSQTKWIMASSRFLMCNSDSKSPASSLPRLPFDMLTNQLWTMLLSKGRRAPGQIFTCIHQDSCSGVSIKSDDDLPHGKLHSHVTSGDCPSFQPQTWPILLPSQSS